MSKSFLRASKIMGALVFIGLLSSCSDNKQAAVEDLENKKPQMQLSSVSDKAWLREQLPESAFVYGRLPSIWYLFDSQDNGLKYALGNLEFVESFNSIKKNIQKNLFARFQLDNQLAKFLLLNVNGPVEFAFMEAESGQGMPTLAIGSTLEFDTVDEFSSAFASALSGNPQIAVVEPTDQKGRGLLQFNGAYIFYQFDSHTHQFSLHAGLGVEADVVKTAMASLVTNDQHPMFPAEQQIDSSGLGVFAWLNPKSTLTAMAPILGQEKVAALMALPLSEVNNISLGYGVSDSKTRLKTLIDMPMQGLREFIPSIENKISLSAVGQINDFMLFSIPTEKHVLNIENGMVAMMGGVPPAYTEFKSMVKQEVGLPFEKLFSILGPEAIYFSDDISQFSALRLNDAEQFNSLLKDLESKGIISHKVHSKNGLSVNEIAYHGTLFSDSFAKDPQVNPLLADVMGKMKSRSYWIQEGDFLILSSIPQPLIERSMREDRVDVSNWLANQQHQDFSGSLLGYSGTITDMSRNSYHIYLSILQALADVSDSELDIFALPLASELGFAEEGTMGFNLALSEPYISMEFTFEQSIFDVIYGGSMQSAAIVGVLAAVALPAYQEYTEKAKAAAAGQAPDGE